MSYLSDSPTKTTAVILFCILTVVGCASESTGDPTISHSAQHNTEISVHGEIEARQLSNGGLDFHAVFLSMNAEFPFSMLEEEYLSISDQCEIYDIENSYLEDPYQLRAEYGLPEQFGEFASISAGITVDFTTAAAEPFWTLYEFAGHDFVRYSQDEFPFDDQSFGAAGIIPDGMKVVIPGNVYPAFELTVPDIPDLAVNRPVKGELITVDTVFEWEPFYVVGASLRIVAKNQSLSVECMIMDDGEFEFPSGIKERLGNEFSANYLLLARTQAVLHTQNDASLVIRRTSNIELL